MRLAILCPGQGGQHPGMFDMLPAERRASLFGSWSLEAALGMPLAHALDAGRIFSNRVAQPLMVAGALACWEVLKDTLPRPSMILGYSAGELAAHGIAGSCTPDVAVELAGRRARLMDESANGEQQGMLAVSGVGLAELRGLVAEWALHVAIETGEYSAVIGGRRHALAEFGDIAAARGARVQLLPVAVASHTPLMQPSVSAFFSLLEARMRAPLMPLLAGVSAQSVTSGAGAADTLARQIAQTIRWAECMDACAEAGITVALELGPCPALSRMLRDRHPQIACRSLSDFRSLQGASAWVARHV